MAAMNALQFEKHGSPLEVLHAAKAPKPQISKDNEVLVRVKASPVNPSDLGFIRGGGYNPVKQFPATAGYEAAGIVEEVGSAVKDVKVGQRVHYQAWNSAWAEYAIIDAARAVIVPDNISFEKAAQFTVNPITVYGMLSELNAKSGEFLLQTASASSLGKMLITIAKSRGIKTINVVRRDDHIEELKKLGADYVINSEKENLVERVKEITNGEGVKHAVDAVGGEVGTQIITALAKHGTVLVYGLLARDQPFNLPVLPLLAKSASVKGFFLGNWAPENVQQLPALYKELIELVSADKLPIDFKTFDAVTQHKEAIQHSIAPGKGEKTILLF